MVKKVILWGENVFNEQGQKAYLDKTKPLVIQVIPEVYFQQMGRSPFVILSPETRHHLLKLREQEINMMQCEYWPAYMGHFTQGCHLMQVPTGEKALFYRDNTLVYFQMCQRGTDDLDLGRNYLKRYGVVIPQSIPELKLCEPLLHQVKYRLISMGKVLFEKTPTSFQDRVREETFETCLPSLFKKSYLVYRRWFLVRLLLLVTNGLLFFLIVFQVCSYHRCIDEIKGIETHLVALTPEQKKISQVFSAFQQYQMRTKPVDFQFGQLIFRQWHPKVVVTALDWLPEGTHYTVLFHPDYNQEIESFMDWLEGQHPRVQINKKDTTNGLLHLFLPTL